MVEIRDPSRELLSNRQPMDMPDCIFCRILAGQAPASLLYEDAAATALLDIHPINPGHALVIAKRHAGSLADLDAESAIHLMRVAHRVAAALRGSGIRCEGVNLLLADGEAAGQDVFHVQRLEDCLTAHYRTLGYTLLNRTGG